MAVTHVGERCTHRVEHRQDLEGHEEQHARDQVFGRNGAFAQVHPVDEGDDKDDQADAPPVLRQIER